jgi:hypothetical protein
MLQDIIRYVKMAESEHSAVPASEVRLWMSSSDPEVLGATYSLLMNEKLAQRVTPSLSFDEVFAFLLRYYEFCLREDPHGERIDGRFTAGSDFVRVFVSYWDERLDKKYFEEMKSLLRRLYLEGPVELQDSIEQAIVEHLFEREDIRDFFSDWRDDPRLKPAYDAGVLWVEGGGGRPLTERRHDR